MSRRRRQDPLAFSPCEVRAIQDVEDAGIPVGGAAVTPEFVAMLVEAAMAGALDITSANITVRALDRRARERPRRARARTARRPDTSGDRRRLVLEEAGPGETRAALCRRLGVPWSTVQSWRDRDPDYRAEMDRRLRGERD